MTRMTVTEQPLALDTVEHDDFIDDITPLSLEQEELEYERYGSTGIDIPDSRYL